MGERRRKEVIEKNKEWNSQQDYSHITDPYFLEKLNNGLIKYDPTEWTEMEEEV
jgi:lipopolysaccharide assembly outer membrane protein LptD (OstA)